MLNKETNAYKNKKKYNMRYFKENNKQMGFVLNKRTDADIISFLDQKPNRNAYLKQLIREDMKK